MIRVLAAFLCLAWAAAEDVVPPPVAEPPPAPVEAVAPAEPPAVAPPVVAEPPPAAPAAPAVEPAPPVPVPPADAPVDVTAMAEADTLLQRFDPDLHALDDQRRPVQAMDNAFTSPASDIAEELAHSNWFSLLIFAPFLILPQVLLIYIIFAFRDRGDGRKPATFSHNAKLEIAWTIIPFIALTIVAIPTYEILLRMERPVGKAAEQVMAVEVRAKRYNFIYTYTRMGDGRVTDPQEERIVIDGGHPDLPPPLVLIKGRPVELHITSQDVNHAWWIPAFGVKKDAYAGRYTYAWFTPTRTGFFKGACAELCGPDHGIMLASAVVVEVEDFAVWEGLMHHRAAAQSVWRRAAENPRAAAAAVADYLAKGATPERLRALRYWTAQGAAMAVRRPSVDMRAPGAPTLAQVRESAQRSRTAIDQAIVAQGKRS